MVCVTLTMLCVLNLHQMSVVQKIASMVLAVDAFIGTVAFVLKNWR